MTTERLTSTPSGVRLCPTDALAEGRARNFVLEIRGRRFHGFVARRQGQVYGYVDRCPHQGLPLAQTLDDYLSPTGEFIICDWHGAIFAVEDGRCLGGPCRGQALSPWPVTSRDGFIETA